MSDDSTIIHKISESTNFYGEFLLVKASRSNDQECIAMTFFGLGYHVYRERWLTNKWIWYQTNFYPEMIHEQGEEKEVKGK